MRLKQNYNIAKKCSGDIITILPGNTKDGTEDIKIRVIEVILDDGTKEYLATNLFDSHISCQGLVGFDDAKYPLHEIWV